MDFGMFVFNMGLIVIAVVGNYEMYDRARDRPKVAAENTNSITMSNSSTHSATHYLVLKEKVEFQYIPGKGVYAGPVMINGWQQPVNYTKEQPDFGEPGLNNDFGHKRGRVGRSEGTTP